MLWITALLTSISSFQLQPYENCVIQTIIHSRVQYISVNSKSDNIFSSIYSHNITLTQSLRNISISIKPQLYYLQINYADIVNFFDLNPNLEAVYIVHIDTGKEEVIRKIIDKFWQHKLFRIIVYKDGVYYHRKCINNFESVITEIKSCVLDFNVFAISHDYECPFVISWILKEPYFIDTNPDDGIEYILLKLIIDQLKLKLIWKKEEILGTYINESWTGALGHIQDMVGGGIVVNEDRYRNFLITYPHFIDKYKWFAAEESQGWFINKINFLKFIPHIGILCFISFCFYIISGKKGMFKTPLVSLINGFRMALGQPLKNQPQAAPMRLLFLSWVIYQMHMTMIYSSALQSSLTTNEVPKIFKKELVSKICSSIEFFNKTRDSAKRNCNPLGASFDFIKFNNSTILADEESMNFILTKYNFNGIVDTEKILRMRLNSFVLPKSSVYYHRINALLQKSVEAGLYSKIRSDVLGRYTMHIHIEELEDNIDIKFMISIILCGWGLALFVFIVEVSWHKRNIIFPIK